MDIEIVQECKYIAGSFNDCNKDLYDEYRFKSLILAFLGNCKYVIEFCLSEGADINAKDNDGFTSLMWASRGGYKDIVMLLLDKGIDVNAADKYGNTALMEASRKGYQDIVILLLDKGANVNATDKYGNTVLMEASWGGHKNLVEFLLAKGTSVNAADKYGNTALIEASQQGQQDIVILLLAKGADVNAKDNDGNTALMWASRKGYKDIVWSLLNQGAGVNITNNYECTALTFAYDNSRQEVSSLLKSWIDTLDSKKAHWNSLMWAANAGNLGRCIALIDNGEYVSNSFLRNNKLAEAVKVLFKKYIDWCTKTVCNVFNININVSSAIAEYLNHGEILALKATRKQDEVQENTNSLKTVHLTSCKNHLFYRK